MKWLLLILAALAGVRALAGNVAIIELRTEASEIRFAAFLSLIQKGEVASVALKICSDPVTQLRTGCKEGKLATDLPLPTFEQRMGEALGIHRIVSAASLTEREKSLLIIRELAKQKFEIGELDASVKDGLEVAMEKMVENSVPDRVTENALKGKELWTTMMGFIKSSNSGLSEAYFREVEEREFDALLSPFATWIEKNTCKCERVVPATSETPVCVLISSDKELARSPATLTSCRTREDCRTREWVGADGKIFNFGEAIESQCSGYFLPDGSLFTKVKSGGGSNP